MSKSEQQKIKKIKVCLGFGTLDLDGCPSEQFPTPFGDPNLLPDTIFFQIRQFIERSYIHREL